ncbi:MAG TPA: helical backbone metal receptor [Chitinivibrionales bacterium]|nr:helical backbone metal receptor [Chitinivibrionales bacterium]
MIDMRPVSLALLSLILAFAGCTGKNPGIRQSRGEYHRIISFAPSITETLFALGAGDRVVGVTRYCNYPPQVKNLPKIGDYLNPNYEMILRLKPDLVLLLKQHSSLSEFLAVNRISGKVIENENVKEILQSFTVIGEICGKTKQADSIKASIMAELSGVCAPEHRPKILFCIGRDNPGSGRISKVYLAGPKSFYNELMHDAGGENVYRDSLFSYPTFSSEGVIRLAPDIIIDVMASVSGTSREKATNDWKELAVVPAVVNGLVFCPAGDYLSIPGPRLGLVFNDIRKAVQKFQQQHRK